VATMNPEASPEAMAAVAQVARIIADPNQRRYFAADPAATLERAGVAVEHIPQRVFEGLSSLSEDELAVLARVCEDLQESGFYVEVPGDGLRCCWF
jgi:hypothetical protein